MKTLLLVRHASSGCDDMSLADRFRPVDARGERELAWLARCARDHGGLLQLIVSSPAQRAMATARVLAEAAGLRGDAVRADDRLYEGGARRLLDLVAGFDDEYTHAAVVGHNPELADLGRHFATAITHLPSAGVAMLRFDAGSWRDAVRGRATHAVLDAPLLPRTPVPPITHPGISA
ncbi:MAG: histidine phosphatase family protein [Piscinibacter sp.]|uniref:SixA phosphatase family protein n=1 Tax=Piscinibacter sp. TaxID=1903157 RepID=UPI003D0E2B66